MPEFNKDKDVNEYSQDNPLEYKGPKNMAYYKSKFAQTDGTAPTKWIQAAASIGKAILGSESKRKAKLQKGKEDVAAAYRGLGVRN